MGSQTKTQGKTWPMIITWIATHTAGGGVVIPFVLGYLIGITELHSPTGLAFLLFTVINLLSGSVLWWLYFKEPIKQWQLVFCLFALAVLAFMGGLCALWGIGYDWLFYFVVVSAFFSFLSIRAACVVSLVLYMVYALNILIVDEWKWAGLFPGWMSVLAGFGFVAVFSLSNRLLNTEQERSQRLLRQLESSKSELEQAHRQLQEYAAEIEELAVARERTRMAREIHDTLGHYLTIISIQLETIGKLQERDPARAAAEVEEAKSVAAQCMQEVRNAVAALRPMSIATLNLAEALAQLGSEFRIAVSHIELTLDLDTRLPALSAEVQLAFYRAAQEALTNVRKHAQAAKVLMRLRYEDEVLELVVRDNGNGIRAEHLSRRTGGFGLIGLRERVELLGGQVIYGPMEPSGYRVSVRLHVPRRSEQREKEIAGCEPKERP